MPAFSGGFTGSLTMVEILKTALERKILRRQQVEARVGLSRSTIYQYIAEGTFPAPVAVGVRAVGWDSAAIDVWIEARLSQGAARRLQGGAV
jgi:prophage regulatory protein